MKSSNSKISVFLASLFLPVVSFVYVLFHPKSEHFKMIVVLFFTFVGLAFFYKGESADVTRYVMDFEQAHLNKNIDLISYYQSRSVSQQIDYYSIFMTWFVSRFTGNSQLFLGLLAFIFAVFLALNISFVIDHIQLTKISVLLLIVLIFIPRIMFLTHRWWTALQVFLFGVLRVVFDKKYLSLLWCVAAAFLFHFSFLYPLIVFVVVLLLPKRVLWLYLLLYIVFTTINSFDFQIFSSFLETYIPEAIAGRTESYINFELQEHNFFSQSGRIAMNIANIMLMTLIYFSNRDSLIRGDVVRKLFATSLLLGSFASLISLTEWGWRYLDLSYMLFVIFYLTYLSETFNYKKSIQVFRLVSPLFLYFLFFQLRGALSCIGPYQLIAGNYVTTWYLHDIISVLDFIKQIF